MVHRLSVGCGAYDRTWPLIAGIIPVDGATLDWSIHPPEEVFLRGMLGGEFDVTEMSSSTYILQVSRGENLYTGLPIFVSRKFRHSAIYIRAEAGLTRPEELKGRRIGVPEYQLTANVWVRGILSDRHGVGVEDVEWLIGGIDQPGREEKVPVDLPDRIRARKIGPEETLWGMMERGELDAIIAPRAPEAFHRGDPRVTRLFADVKAAEKAYFAATGIFPIMHVIGVRNELLRDSPGLAAALYAAFEAARQHAVKEVHQVAYDIAMLPWQASSLEETEALMGPDYWTYGLEGNRDCVETMCRYAFEQGITPRRLSADDIFPVSCELASLSAAK